MNLLVLALVLTTPRAPLDPAAGLERTQSLIAALKTVAPLPAQPAASDLAARDRQFVALDGYFDLDTLVTQALAPRASKLAPADLERVRKAFREVLRKAAYTVSGDAFRKGRLSVRPLAATEDALPVRVAVHVPAEDMDRTIDFVWRPVGGALKVVDVRLEGDSLVKDYQNQVARLVDKGGAEGLLKALEKKQAAVAGAR